MYPAMFLLLYRGWVQRLLALQPVIFMIFQLASVVSFQNDQDDSSSDGLQNVSKTIEDLLDGYDIRLRPQFGGM